MRPRSRWLALTLPIALGLAGAAQADAGVPVISLLVATSADAGDVTWLAEKRGPFVAPAPVRGLDFVAAGGGATQFAPAVVGREYPRLGFVAQSPGHFEVQLARALLSLDAVEVRALDYRGRSVNPKTSHASLSRTLPAELGAIPGEDQDALSFVLLAPSGVDLDALEVLTRGATGLPLDVLPRLMALPAACPEGTAPELVCRQTPAIRAVGDALDRSHPAAQKRTIVAQVGGSLRLSNAGRKLVELAVGGPRETRLGPLERLRVRLRTLVLRAQAGGPPAVGGDAAGAKRVMEQELETAAALWGQCGIELGAAGERSIQVVEPPSARLVALGCGFAQVASGGSIELRSGQKLVRLVTRPGETPVAVGQRLSEALERARFTVSVFENQRTANSQLKTVDLLLGWSGGKAEEVSVTSTDPTLSVCLGEVELSDGLKHFGEGDAFSGTLEERTLLRAFDDGDPRTVEIVVVPSFARSERIGESFISSPGSSLSSTVIIDRAAIRAGARSFALAHELGHVLLAMPGHPDDFGVDQPFSLMDSDVADATIFGPRRLSIADCERAVTQSGPESFVPLLQRVPLRSPSAPSAVKK
ncbi:MAG TPA: hypothetical protein VJN18_16335 [Polyangiaceae bacterium]|nr:hypothetical protein [Polyangiaceae bacterium]